MQMHNHLSYWEIEAFLKYKTSFIRDACSEIFSKCDICAGKLHHVVNDFSEEYNTLTQKEALPFPQLIDHVVKELKQNGYFERNEKNPLFFKHCLNENSLGIRLSKGINITPAFLISFLLATYHENTEEFRAKKGRVFMMAGELNFISYEKLKDFYFDLIMGEGLQSISSIECIAGPFFSCDDTFNKAKGSLVDSNFFIKLYLENRHRDKINLWRVPVRENFHFMVHEYDDSVCLIEDYHLEFKERAATLVFDNSQLCNELRSIAKKVIDQSLKMEDENSIRKSLKTKSEIEKIVN